MSVAEEGRSFLGMADEAIYSLLDNHGEVLGQQTSARTSPSCKGTRGDHHPFAAIGYAFETR